MLAREHGIGDGKLLRVLAAEVGERLDHPVCVLRLAEFAHRRHKLVAHDGKVVPVREPVALALRHVHAEVRRIRPAVVHVEPREVRSAAELHHREREGVHRLHQETAVVARRHSAAELAGEVRILLRALRVLGLLCPKLLRGDHRRRARGAHEERLLVRAGHGLQLAIPEALGVVSVERDHLAERRLRSVEARPSGARVHRHVVSRVHGEFLERLVVRPRTAALVLELHADHRAAVLPEVRRDLPADALEELLRLSEEPRVARAQQLARLLRVTAGPIVRLVDKPVREASLAALAVRPGADSHDRPESGLLHLAEERGEVAVSGEVPLALLPLVVVPEDVCRDDGDSALLHRRERLRPLAARDARVVHFAHKRNQRSAVQPQALRRDIYAVSVRRDVRALWNHRLPRAQRARRQQYAVCQYHAVHYTTLPHLGQTRGAHIMAFVCFIRPPLRFQGARVQGARAPRGPIPPLLQGRGGLATSIELTCPSPEV